MDLKYKIEILPHNGPEGQWVWMVNELRSLGVWDNIALGYASDVEIAAREAEQWYMQNVEHDDECSRTIDPKPPHWEPLRNLHDLLSGYFCTYCRYQEENCYLVNYQYCPHCGKYMKHHVDNKEE